MYEYLNDIEFLSQLDKVHARTQKAKIVLLTFQEKPIREIQGNITSGSLNINGSSSIRRTISMTMIANETNSDIENIDNEISVKRKVKIFIGFDNPLKDYIEVYGKTIWFPCGIFVLSNASISRSTTGWTISISGKDKMCLLDGSVGGMLPASTTFHTRQIIDKNGDITTEYPTIFQIIFEAVNHWGGEAVENIIITDIDDTVKMLVRYMGSKPIYFTPGYEAMTFADRQPGFTQRKIYGQDVGYKETDFTYPEELILKAGDSVVTLLEKIKSVLGNFEYFYDINGRFIFQEIKNYLNQQSPLRELDLNDYVKSYNNMKYLYSLTDLDTTVSIVRNPKYDNIKNDFYVWGQRETASGVERDIRYHLAIDTKPILDFALRYMWEVKDIQTGLILRYDFSSIEDDEIPFRNLVSDTLIKGTHNNMDESEDQEVDHYYIYIGGVAYWSENKEELINTIVENREQYRTTVKTNEYVYDLGKYQISLIGGPCTEWREELYRQALNAQVTNSVYNNYYDSELIAEWRKLYDPTNKNWDTYNHWNPAVEQEPESLDFWLDFIDTSAAIGQYSIGEIGRRTKVINDTKIKSIYNQRVEDVVFIEGADEELISHYNNMGQKYFILTPEYYDLFAISTTGASCFDRIREMLYQNLSYNTTISLTCLPKYYMDVNNIIHIEDRKSNINGNYLITQLSLPLAYNGTMSITATEVLTRV